LDYAVLGFLRDTVGFDYAAWTSWQLA